MKGGGGGGGGGVGGGGSIKRQALVTMGYLVHLNQRLLGYLIA